MKNFSGLVYIGSQRKNFTHGKFYKFLGEDTFRNMFKYGIMDDCGCRKFYIEKNEFFTQNFKKMSKEEYILWSRKLKIQELNSKT